MTFTSKCIAGRAEGVGRESGCVHYDRQRVHSPNLHAAHTLGCMYNAMNHNITRAHFPFIFQKETSTLTHPRSGAQTQTSTLITTTHNAHRLNDYVLGRFPIYPGVRKRTPTIQTTDSNHVSSSHSKLYNLFLSLSLSFFLPSFLPFFLPSNPTK